MTEIEEYLKKISEICSGKQKKCWLWLTENGKSFTEKDRDVDNEKEIIANPPFHIKRRACFYNSQILVLLQNDLQYFEGFLLGGILPFPSDHGFAVKKEKVTDISARKWKIDTTEWFGVHIPTEFVREAILKNEYAGPLLWKWYGENLVIA